MMIERRKNKGGRIWKDTVDIVLLLYIQYVPVGMNEWVPGTYCAPAVGNTVQVLYVVSTWYTTWCTWYILLKDVKSCLIFWK